MKLDIPWLSAAAVLARNTARTYARLTAAGVTCTVRFEIATRPKLADALARTEPALRARPDLAALVRRRGGPL
jgi:hypothetical protein